MVCQGTDHGDKKFKNTYSMNIQYIRDISIEVLHTVATAKLINRYMYFDLPFVVMVEDGFEGKIREDGKKICQVFSPRSVPSQTER